MTEKNINKKFDTLFLDRDGVINNKIENGYVLKWEDFIFKSNVLENFHILNIFFKRIIIVTNQKCVGRGLISEDELNIIHCKMVDNIKSNLGFIDKIYFCPSVFDNDMCRKPNPGMFYQSIKDFPDIEINERSFMVGDSLTDMIPAKKIGLRTILIGDKNIMDLNPNLIDFQAKELTQIKWDLII